jgi:hypothetical protein
MYAFFISNKPNGAGTVYPSGTPEFTPRFSEKKYKRTNNDLQSIHIQQKIEYSELH